MSRGPLSEAASMQKRLEVVGELASLILASYDQHRVFRDAILKFREALDFRRASVALVTDEGSGYTLHTLYDEARGGFSEQGVSFAFGIGLTGRVIATGVAVCENRFPGISDIREPGEGAVSVLAVPLESEGKVIGALTFGASKPDVYSDEDLELASVLARQIGSALHQMKLFMSGEDRRHELEALIEASDAPMLLTRDGRVVHLNRAMAALAGRTRELLTGAPISTIHGLLEPRVADPAALALEEHPDEPNVAIRDRIEFTRPEPKSFVRTVAPVFDASGETVGQVVYYRDVTVEDRAVRANQGFVSMVSHELRTPLASVTASLKLLTMGAAGDVGDPVKQYLDIALRNLERLIRLVNDLLDVSRLHRGKLDVTPSAVPVASALNQALEVVRAFADERGVRLRIAESDSGIVALANADRLEQILVNLLSNAVKFSPEHGTVTVGWWKDDGSAVLEVADEGPGVPAGMHEAIFESFHQLDGAARAAGGIGLGLAISRELIESMGGSIWSVPAGDKGARFRIAVPSHGRSPM